MFHEQLLSVFAEFATNHSVAQQANWRPFADNNTFPAGYWTSVLAGGAAQLVNATRAAKCAMWKRHGLTRWWWQQ